MAQRIPWEGDHLTVRLPVQAAIGSRLERAGVRVAARTRARPPWTAPRPWHPFHWVGLTLAGRVHWSCREGSVLRSGTARRGSALVFPRRVPYWLECASEGWTVLWFSIAEAQRPQLAHAAFAVEKRLFDGLLGAADALEREWRSQELDHLEATASHAALLAIQLNRLLGAQAEAGAHPLTRLVERIARTPASPWTVPTLAGELGMSERQTHRAIRRHCLCTPGELIQRLRMRSAQELLGERTLGLEAIARAVGYADASAFSHAFKRCLGRSPERWRSLRWSRGPRSAPRRP